MYSAFTVVRSVQLAVYSIEVYSTTAMYPLIMKCENIIRVSPTNYQVHADLMEVTRTFRQEHLWPVEYFTSPLGEYRISDTNKITFVAVNKKHEFVGIKL